MTNQQQHMREILTKEDCHSYHSKSCKNGRQKLMQAVVYLDKGQTPQHSHDLYDLPVSFTQKFLHT